jgi:ERF superfamily
MTDIVQFPSGTPAPATLVGAIAAVMNEVHTVAKRGVNEFHRYRYAKMEDILQEITPLLGKHGLVIFQSETGRAMFDEDNVIAVEYSFTVAHVSGETWPQPLRQTGVSMCRNSKGGWDDKSLNKCHTAARKYFLLALFQIPTGEEADADRGENDGGRVSEKPSISDRAIEARRAAVQLNRSFSKPAHVIEPPQRKLQRELNKQRHTGSNYEAQIKAEQRDRRTGKFQEPMINGQYDERNPPPDINDDIPGFLDRRGR